MDLQAHRAGGGLGGFPGVHAHPHPELLALGPGPGGKGPLHIDRCRESR